MYKRVSLMFLCLILFVTNGFIGSQWLGTASAAAPTTVTFSTTTDSSAWTDGIAEDGEGGSTDILGKVFQFFNISDVSGTMMPGNLIFADTEADGWFPFLTTYETDINIGWKGMGIRTSDASEFQINGFFYSNWGEGPINLRIEGYRDGAKVATHSFINDELIADYHSKHVSLNEDFDNVDLVLLYSTDKNSWHGINDIVLDDAVVSAAAPTINIQPADETANVGASNPTLSLGATASDGGTLSYQWYSNTANSTTGGMAINGATSLTYAAPTTSEGTTYYYVIVTNTNNGVNGTKTAMATSNVAQVTVNALVHAAAPTINIQPANEAANLGASSPTLSVNATVSDGGTLSYKWYSNTTNSTTGGTLISGATSSTYAAPTTSEGTTYYYVTVTNINNGVNGTKTATTTSNAVYVTVNALVHAAAPTINIQPANEAANLGASSPTLSVNATVSDGGTLSYKWYSNTTNSTTGGTLISGATSSTYTAPTTSEGTIYYYIIVTNTNNGVNGMKTATTTSNAAQVTVSALIDAAAPTINTQPADATVDEGASSPTLSVGATISDGGTLSYQWYSNTVNSTTGGTPINAATSSTYAAPTTSEGTIYYYVIVTNTNNGINGMKTATMTSNIAVVVIQQAQTYVIENIADQTPAALIQGYASGSQETLTNIVKNIGTGTLTNLEVISGGTNGSDFEVTQPTVSTLNQGAETNFTVKVKDGLPAGTYTATLRISADNMLDQTFQVVQAINLPNAPANPQDLVLTPGDRQVQLTWSNVPGATYYEVYLSTVSGQFSSNAITTVTDGNYRVENLINGTTYFFMVKAGGLGGLSAESNVASATPLTVPEAPSSVIAVAGNGQATLSFNPPTDNGGSAVTSYEVNVLPDNRVVTGTRSPIIITGLTNGTSYTFTVKAKNQAGGSESSLLSNAIVPLAPTGNGGNTGGGGSIGGSGGNTNPSQPPTSGTQVPNPGNSGVDVMVNGKLENIGSATSSERNSQSVTTITVDSVKLDEKLTAEGNGATVTILLNKQSDVVIGELNGQMIKSMEDKKATLKIQTPSATYTLPSQQINIQALSNQLGQSINLKDILIQIEISTPGAEMLRVITDATEKNRFTLVAPTYNFEVRGIYVNRTINITHFNAYVERTIAIPEGVDPNRITTGVVIDTDGSVRHVPTQIVVNDTNYYAKVNSLSNSTYSIVWNPIQFQDMQTHWAKAEVNDMGSRMVMEGTGEGMFTPERDITRAEFAMVLVRGLGLKLDSSKNVFSDVAADAWYSRAINTAYEYQLLDGFRDGTFRPDDKITREQAMNIMARAMDITGLKEKLPVQSGSTELQKYIDISESSVWANKGIAESIQAGIFSGRSDGKLAPKAYITRAEVAAIVERLLQKSGLI
ncbi:S-layer homology domain-containing protein [Paenibacillus sp. FSL K6-4396]|uniref:S-layer homology domain-containing protein n=1 Tax=unclassified Paenibacillus TaxID=185978 RepID=UPI001FD07692|nr:S-layer homology domain-containing protein [Paenibacillus sp. CFBP 13594]